MGRFGDYFIKKTFPEDTVNIFRRKRFALLVEYLHSLDLGMDKIRILDVGGRAYFWKQMKWADNENIEITILNCEEEISQEKTAYDNLKYVVGNACNMQEFRDNEFDIVFSNSVIEHVGGFGEQEDMAREVQRVGRYFFLQTPNYWFPLEPHFLTLGFQFFPLAIKTFLIRHFNLGWFGKITNYDYSVRIAKNIRLLRKSELKRLFPGAGIIREKLFGLTKSFIVYKKPDPGAESAHTFSQKDHVICYTSSVINYMPRWFFSEWGTGDYCVLAGMAIMFLPTLYKLATLGWKDTGYTHAYFILPISLWLIFRKRKNLVKREGTDPAGSVLFALGLLIYIFAVFNEFMFLEAFSFVLVMWALFKMRFDKGSFRSVAFPLSYLLFLVPPPALAIDTITFPLKQIATWGSFAVLKLVGLPVEVYGVILKIGEHELFITAACSGFRSTVTLLALGAIYAYVQKIPVGKKVAIFLSVIPLGMLGNILRISMTGGIAYYIGLRYAEGFFHQFSGGVLFLFTIGGLIGLTELICTRRCKHSD